MKICKVIGLMALSLLLCSCAGQQQKATPTQGEYAKVSSIEGVSLETVQKEPKVVSGYENIVLDPLQISPQFAKDYPETASQFQSSLLQYLREKNVYKHVEEAQALKAKKPKGKTLIVDVKVVDMRIVNQNTRFWAGAMAGSSHIDLYLKLTDAASRKVIHEKLIATNNNAFASAWAVGSENSLPTDMGRIIGEYICTVAPVK